MALGGLNSEGTVRLLPGYIYTHLAALTEEREPHGSR